MDDEQQTEFVRIKVNEDIFDDLCAMFDSYVNAHDDLDLYEFAATLHYLMELIDEDLGIVRTEQDEVKGYLQ